MAVRTLRYGHRRHRGAARARRGRQPRPPRAVLGRRRAPRRGGPRRRPRRRGRQPDRHPRRAQLHARPAPGHAGPRRRAEGQARPAVRLQGRRLRHLPGHGHQRRGGHAPQLRPRTARARRRLRPNLSGTAADRRNHRRLRRLKERASDRRRQPAPGELEPIETASVDELRALQLERLRWSLRHAYDNVPYYRKMFDVAAVHPDDVKDLSDLAKFPFTTKASLRDNYPFGMFAVPREQVARVHASSGTTGRPTVVGYTAADIDTWANVMARSIRAAGGRPGHIVHVAYGYGLFTGGLGAHYGAERLGCTVVPVSGGMTERQVTLISDFQPDVIMVTPSYMLNIIDEMERQGLDPASRSLQVRHLRRRAVDERDARRDGGPRGHRRHRHLRPVRGHGPRRGPGVRGDQGRPARLGRPLLPGGHRPGHRRGAARRRAGRAGLHLADQAGDARHPLPHPRPHPAAAGHRPHDAPHREDHRPHRRHDHPARRQPVPDPGRGADPGHPRPVTALPAPPVPQRPHGRHDRPRGAPPGRHPGRAEAAGAQLATQIKNTIGVTTAIVVEPPAPSNAAWAKCAA